MNTNYKQLRYGLGAIKTTLETVQHTATDVMSDLKNNDDEWKQAIKALYNGIESWKQTIDRNIEYCREEEEKERGSEENMPINIKSNYR